MNENLGHSTIAHGSNPSTGTFFAVTKAAEGDAYILTVWDDKGEIAGEKDKDMWFKSAEYALLKARIMLGITLH